MKLETESKNRKFSVKLKENLGMEIKIISNEQALFLLAAVITIVSAMLTLVGYSLRRTRYPFLQFYVIVIFAIAVTYWIVIKWNFGPVQIE